VTKVEASDQYIESTVDFRDHNDPVCLDQEKERLRETIGSGQSVQIIRYRFDGAYVYYITPACCDLYGTVLDEQCEAICAPDGGFTGRGDGKCPDFFDKAKDAHQIWQYTKR
jgi:hypothetical protein